MKKLAVFALAALLVVAFTVPASALENVFGGYWRTRAYMQENFNGKDVTTYTTKTTYIQDPASAVPLTKAVTSTTNDSKDTTKVDTRTRLYYTAKINDNLKLVNKFEFNATWGDTVGGDIGSDSTTTFRIKNSYADFNYADLNFKIGTQGMTLSRGILFDDDFSGAVVTYKGDGFAVPFIWIKAYEGEEVDTADVDYYAIAPSFNLSDTMTINPYIMYVKSGSVDQWTKAGLAAYDNLDLYYLGVDFDAKFDSGSLWFTGIYETGSADVIGGGSDDISAYVLAIGGSYNFDGFTVKGQVFYATGQDQSSTSTDIDAFFVPAGQSYYWAEIMGLGIIDNQASANAPGDAVSDLIFYNLGTSFKAADNVTLKADLWYAQLAEDDANGEDKLGTEVDLVANIKLMDNLNLDLVAAYLFAGDATYKGADDADPYEIGSRLSLSF